MQYPVKITRRGSSNGRVLNALRSGRIGYTIAFRHYFERRVRFGVNDFTPAAATSQTINLHEIAGGLPFPENVRRLPGTFAYVPTGLVGTSVTVANIEIGDAEDPNGLLTASSVLPAAEGYVASTLSAAENATRREAAFVPTLRVVLDQNMTALTGGEIWVYIPWEPIPQGA